MSASPGLYIHVPFCKTKCPYCDFYSITDTSLIAAWLEALEREARLYQGLFPAFDTLYLGGGTPSLLTSDVLVALLDLVLANFDFHPDTEITLEANPDDLSRDNLMAYRDLGINRLSLGVQSLDDRELQFLGRRHTARQAVEALEWARAAGFAGLGIDLIYGLPGQSVTEWRKSLEKVMAFEPEHLSCYQLSLEAETELGRRRAAGDFALPGEEEERNFFLFTSEFLEDNGYLHYEVSNFARGEGQVSRHNSKYWRHAPYLGLGPAAHSFQEGRRWWNCRSVAEYADILSRGQAPVAGEEALTAEQIGLEALLLGFRTRAGVDLSLIKKLPQGEAALQQLVEAALLAVQDGCAVPTREGLALADRLPLWFE